MKAELKNVAAKKILTEAKGYLDVGFTHSLNPYSGCVFACRYCYVRELPIQKFRDLDWGNWVDMKTNAAENYRNEMLKLRKKNKAVKIFMSSATDPYQPIERDAQITRSVMEQMVENPPDFLQIQTRGPLVTRDLNLLVQLNEKCEVWVSMTLETDREDVKRIFAPLAPGIQRRLEALREIHEAGISTQAAISPVLPFTPDFPKLLNGWVDRVWIDTLSIGDGSLGKRSERLGMPQLFQEHGFIDWYKSDLHLQVAHYFKKFFPQDKVLVSREEAFLSTSVRQK
ncbi:radical SAM protein [Alicyclobacillus sp. TC]|uniref:DNA repair photolyase n=2 Tax=Alicyclobacillus tolerans TaxID=90970 RepID=A0ABT9LS47_9BACL|nr:MULTISPECIES: radical SAM protein [Alicyclobacillus]MDP9727089.1 DNA repair photolyase [Alicyclobacillus tengchongensis]QRF22865.1 radical SAM protein [Alicyclobacillus sp. TC]SHK74287.1 Radical SAM superfamily protein [Alicyclobacillus montanus]